MESAGDQASSEYTGATYGLDSTQKFTVVTRFVTVDTTDNGDLKEMQRFYIQNGRTTQQPVNYQNYPVMINNLVVKKQGE